MASAHDFQRNICYRNGLYGTTLNRFQFVTTLLQQIAWLSWYTYRFLCNNIALKIVPCNITCIEACFLTLAACF